MSGYLLDTAFLVDLERNVPGAVRLLDDDADVAIAAVTAAELMLGIELATDEHRDSRRDRVESVFRSVPVIDYDLGVAAVHASLLADVRRTGRPRGAHDLMVAATARRTGRTVVSADRSAFTALAGVEVLAYDR